ncbi:MAG: hypothetical protein K1X74_17350 [Pirellulales bacterium]|nr:hypothetical protein [Pirellulales bacterium]
MSTHEKQPGRPLSTTAERAMRVDRILDDLAHSERDEFLNFIGYQFAGGVTTQQELAAAIRARFETDLELQERYLAALKKLRLLDAISKLARHGRFAYLPPEDERLKRKIALRYGAALLGRQLTIVPTVAPEPFATSAAVVLLDAINRQAAHSPNGVVHVGFAGGRTLRSVAAGLAQRLQTMPESAPDLKELVLHSLVAAFEDADDWHDDPNSFITYFVEPNVLPCRIRHVKMQVPAIVERTFFDDRLKTRPEFRRPFEEAQKISILITSGSLWDDPNSIIKSQLGIFAKRSWPNANRGQEFIDALDQQGVIGDLLWHPLTTNGWVDLDKLEFRIATALDLIELPNLIRRPEGLTSIVVLGCSGKTAQEKSTLANAILRLPPEKQVFTHLILDAPTARGLLATIKPR